MCDVRRFEAASGLRSHRIPTFSENGRFGGFRQIGMNVILGPKAKMLFSGFSQLKSGKISAELWRSYLEIPMRFILFVLVRLGNFTNSVA